MKHLQPNIPCCLSVELVLILLLSQTSLAYTFGKGEVRVVLSSLSNPYGTRSNNECCSGTKDPSTSVCSEPCRIFATVCITPTKKFFQDTFCAMGTRKTKTYNRNEVTFRLPKNSTHPSVYNDHKSFSKDVVYAEIGQDKFEENVMVYKMRHTLRDEVRSV